MKRRIYIAGALNADACQYIKNLSKMCCWAVQVKAKGFSVFVPGLDFLLGFWAGSWEYETYFKNNQPWLEVSDAVFLVPGWENSKGTKKEIELAKKFNIPLFTKLEQLEEIK